MDKANEFSIKIGEIKRERLYQLSLSDFKCHGCYAVFDRDRCLYIGSSTNVRKRVMAHFVLGGNGRQWICLGYRLYSGPAAPIESWIVAIQSEDPKMLEHLLILAFKPMHNSKLTGKAEKQWRLK